MHGIAYRLQHERTREQECFIDARLREERIK